MTDEQKDQLRELINAVQAIKYSARGSYLPFEVAAAIERADIAQAACYEIAWPAASAE